MKHREVLFGLREVPGVGEITIKKLVKGMGDLSQLPDLGVEDLVQLGVQRHRAQRINQMLTPSYIEERMELTRKAGVKIIVLGDKEYPFLLSEITYPPSVLYVKGDAELLKHPSIAVVGTRRATSYGKRATRRFVMELAACGFGIVSGMARGIDTEAHRTSLEAGAPSIAVLGTGLDVIYPKENKQLIERMMTEGVVISENPLGQTVKQGLFYVRNRIIAGLSLGTLVVEADEKSGSLITVDYADQHHRDVFVVPGSIFSPQSRGTLKLMKDHFPCVTDVGDIVQAYPYMFAQFNHKIEKERATVPLTPDESLVLSYLTEEETTIDELLQKTKFAFGHLHIVLLSLTIEEDRNGETLVYQGFQVFNLILTT